jgi:Asp-tRNA(Asn)/Glu-tRNA(Gln) amidotransferase A subunit family amidase
MADTPWLGDTCSLVDAFRTGERSPAEELEATFAAIDSSGLNAFSFIDRDRARAAAASADVARPFGGVATGVKELEPVEGWPETDASLVFKDRIATVTGTAIERLERDGGAVLVGQTTASEFGGLNVSITKLNGVTGNAWDPARTAGGSSGGSAAAVAGGLVPIATGGDGGGSIRIPAGFNGLVGMKGTAGRIPRGPRTTIAPLTVVIGCLARSVRDVARWYDVCAGYDMRDPYSLPKVDGWERDLGTRDLAGLRVAVLPDLRGYATVRTEVADLVDEAGRQLAEAAGMVVVDDVAVDLPTLGYEWAMTNLVTLREHLGPRWPDCADDMTMEMGFGLKLAEQVFTLEMAGAAEAARTRANEAMAAIYDEVDIVLCATNPNVAYPADVTLNVELGGGGSTVMGIDVGAAANNGALTIPANIVGNPSCSVPVGTVDGLPVGMQIMGRHHSDALLLDLAGVVERERPWPLVAPSAPR